MGEQPKKENAGEEKVSVRNAGDPEQVKKAAKADHLNRKAELNDLRTLLALPAFRRFIWRMLSYCKVFGSVWHPSALIHHNSGQQDVGHWVMGELAQASQDSFLVMMKENYNKENDNG